MSQALTVWRKELLELLGDRHSRRGALVQAAVAFVALGIFVPAQSADAWLSGSPTAPVIFLVLAPILAGILGADAFAGERERHTLETLFATPVSPRAIVLGKAAAAVTYSYTVCCASLVAAVITVNVVGRPPALFIPAALPLVIVLGGAFAAAALVAMLSIVISSRVAVARAAQQMTSLLSAALIGAFVMVWRGLGLEVDLRTVIGAELAVLAIATIALPFAADLFRPDRLLR